MWRTWADRRVAALLAYHLKHNYAKAHYMCNCLRWYYAPWYLDPFGFVTKHALKHVRKSIAGRGTLISFLQRNHQWPRSGWVDSQFIAQAGFPFFTTLISKLRGSNHVAPIQAPIDHTAYGPQRVHRQTYAHQESSQPR